jgi:hypothetical protein
MIEITSFLLGMAAGVLLLGIIWIAVTASNFPFGIGDY